MSQENSVRTLSFKVDVDTHDGMKKGVPLLLEIFAQFHLKATFFLSFGPDNAGKAIFQIFRQRGFLKKMLRTKAPGLYGLRTVLSGTLLPPRPIAIAFPELVRRIEAEGHEAGVHAWDHRYWQDHLSSMKEEKIQGEFLKSFTAFKEILGKPPLSVAAPGWQVTQKSIKVQDGLGLLYASDLRNGPPCIPEIEGYTATTMQIPTNVRCLEELIASGIQQPEKWEETFLSDVSSQTHVVFPLHTEVEGGKFAPFFRNFLPRLLQKFSQVITLKDYAQKLLEAKNIPVREIKFAALPGRGGLVASGE